MLTSHFLLRFDFASATSASTLAHGAGWCPADAGLLGLLPETAGELSPLSRSEEHTSELQSRVDLVCRLLLEKNNQRHGPTRAGADRIQSARQCTAFVRGAGRDGPAAISTHEFDVQRRAGRAASLRQPTPLV